MIEIILIVICIVLIIATRPISKTLFVGNIDQASLKARVLFMRVINLLIIALLVLKLAYPSFYEQAPWLMNLLYVLATIYLLYLLHEIGSYFITRHFGEPRIVGEEQQYSDIYSSRALILFSGGLLATPTLQNTEFKPIAPIEA